MLRTNNIKTYKCYIRSLKAKIKLCGIYYKKKYKLIRLLGESNLVYSIIINNDGNFQCNCPYYLNNKINCKHIFFLFFVMFKIFSKWISSDSKIYLKRYSHPTLIKHDETFLNGKLNEVSLLLLLKKIKLFHFKLMDQKLYELDNYYLKLKNNRNTIFDKYYSTLENNEICSICLNNKNTHFKCPHCKKRFHLSCINKWIKINPSCPTCRNDLKEYKKFIDLINSEYNNIKV